MKKWIILIALGLIAHHLSFSQVFDLKKYNELVNVAEVAICNNKLEAATNNYNQAFAIGTPSAMDVENALFCAIELKDEKNASKLAFILARLGIGSEYFKKKKSIAWLKSSSDWAKIIEQAAKDASVIRTDKAALIERLDRMAIEARDYILHVHKNNNISNDELEIYRDSARTLVANLHQLLSEHGYLSEKLIGVYLVNDTTISNPIFYDIMKLPSLLYFYPEASIYDGFTPVLLDAVEKGDLSINLLLELSFTNFGQAYSFPQITRSGCTAYYFDYEIAEVLVKRVQVGLSNYEDYITKCRFNITNPSTLYNIYPQSLKRADEIPMISGIENLKQLCQISSCK